jgi:adenylate cyclase
MVRISFLDHTFIDVEKGSNLMSAIIASGRPIGNSCSAIGICGKCFIRVMQGMENLSGPNPVEKNLLSRENLPSDYRISCLTKVLGPVTVNTSYW